MKISWLAFGAFLLEVVAAGREWFDEAKKDGTIDAAEVSAFVDLVQEIATRHFNDGNTRHQSAGGTGNHRQPSAGGTAETGTGE